MALEDVEIPMAGADSPEVWAAVREAQATGGDPAREDDGALAAVAMMCGVLAGFAMGVLLTLLVLAVT